MEPPYEHAPLPTVPDEESDTALRQRLAYLEQAGGRGALLDIGGASERFRELACARGWRVAEVEPMPSCERPHDDTGLPALRIPAGEGRWPAGNFDAISISRGLEHASDPTELVRLAAYYCRIDGVLAVNTLNGDQLTRNTHAIPWNDGESPLRLYSPIAIHRFLGRFGFRTVLIAPTFIAEHSNAVSSLLTVVARYVP